jgi:hypothetical protein
MFLLISISTCNVYNKYKKTNKQSKTHKKPHTHHVLYIDRKFTQTIYQKSVCITVLDHYIYAIIVGHRQELHLNNETWDIYKTYIIIIYIYIV